MADLREQIVRALVATWEDPEQGPDALDYEAADAVLAVVEPAIRQAQAEGIREAVAAVRWVYDLQCPVQPGDHYAHKWARVAHRWWEKVLGGQLDRLSRRAREIAP